MVNKSGITDIDPLEHDLLFTRFLNPERQTMPDIDIDFDDTRRHEVFDYLRETYGEDRTAHIITFQTLSDKSGIKNFGRVLGLEFSEANAITKKLDDRDLDEALDDSGELTRMAKEDDRVARTFRFTEQAGGYPRGTGIHAAGMVITPGPLTDYVPTARVKHKALGRKVKVTQFDMDYIDAMGLLKMDVLGLKTLRIIRNAINLVEEVRGETVDEEAMRAHDDPEVYREIFAKGLTLGCFQFESDGMRQWLKKLKPSEFNDLISMNALYRPGPMKLIPDYIARKHGKEEVEYFHPDVEDILETTYGIMVFQEQVMQVLQRLAGFSLGKADITRRAIGKKKAKLLDKQKKDFVQGCLDNGISKEKANEVFGLIEEFAEYGFNRCIPGDTKLWRTGMTVRELYEAKERGEALPEAYSMQAEEGQHRDEDLLWLKPNEIVDVRHVGEREVFRITLDDMHGTREPLTIEATANHKFPVPAWEGEDPIAQINNGYRVEIKRLDELKVGDDLFVRDGSEENDDWWATSRGIASIEPVGTKPVYDVEMAAPYHNFVTEEGVVTCNSHAAAYSAIAYQTGWLKCHYPVAFYAAAVDAEDDDESRAAIIQEAKARGIEMRPPSVNKSHKTFAPDPDEDAIRFGLEGLKQVGQEAEKIIAERRQNGEYASFRDLCERALPNAGALKSLILAGACDEFGHSRAALHAVYEDMLAYARKLRDYRAGRRQTMPPIEPIYPEDEWPAPMRFAQEREVAGTYLSGHPLQAHAELARRLQGRAITIHNRGEAVRLTLRPAVVTSIDRATTKHDTPMYWISLTTLTQSITLPMWMERYERFSDVIREGAALVVGLKPSPRHPTPSIWAAWPINEWPVSSTASTPPTPPDPDLIPQMILAAIGLAAIYLGLQCASYLA